MPHGYQVDSKRLVVDEFEAIVVREIFALYLEHRSALVVARLLRERHHATRRRRPRSGHPRAIRQWTKSDVLRVLGNPLYAGYIPSGGALFDGEHEPIIDRATFARTRALLEASARTTGTKGRNPEYILRGVLRCASCGSAMTPASTRKGSREYRYYRCVKRDEQGREACPSAPLPAGAIETHVIERLREAAAGGDLAADIAARVAQRATARRKDLAIARQKLPIEIAALSAEGKRLVAALADAGEGARRLIDERLQELGEQLARCEARLATVQREISSLDAVEIETAWVARCLTDFDRIWDVLTPVNRGRLLGAMIERVEVDEPANQVSVFLADLARQIGPTPISAEPTPISAESTPISADQEP